MKYTLQVNRGIYYASCRIKDINGKIVQISKSTGLKAVEKNRAAAEKRQRSCFVRMIKKRLKMRISGSLFRKDTTQIWKL